MKGDCQRFGVARQRRFSVVWDGFSRGFPQKQKLGREFREQTRIKILRFGFVFIRLDSRLEDSQQEILLIYSYLSARNGSVFIARRAGMYDATTPTAASSRATEMRVTGSDGETPTNSDPMPRPARKLNTNPASSPAPTNTNPWRRTIFKMSARPAPNAMRTPISCVRCDAAYEMTL